MNLKIMIVKYYKLIKNKKESKQIIKEDKVI